MAYRFKKSLIINRNMCAYANHLPPLDTSANIKYHIQKLSTYSVDTPVDNSLQRSSHLVRRTLIKQLPQNSIS